MPSLRNPPPNEVDNVYFCPDCPWSSSDRTSYPRHRNQRHKTMKFICRCEAGFPRKDNFERHSAVCDGVKRNKEKRGRKPQKVTDRQFRRAYPAAPEEELQEMMEVNTQLTAKNNDLEAEIVDLRAENAVLRREVVSLRGREDELEEDVAMTEPSVGGGEVPAMVESTTSLEAELSTTFSPPAANIEVVNAPRRSLRRPGSEIVQERWNIVERKLLESHDMGLGLEVSEIPGKGRGIIAKRDICKGMFVCEYAGLHYRMSAAHALEAGYDTDPSVGSYTMYYQHGGSWFMVDATSEENNRFGRLLNHSRVQPNCKAKVVVLNKKTPRLILVALKNIVSGEELTHNYGGDQSAAALEANPWLGD